MKRDMIDFLRRLPIIMLEDTCLHNSISVLIWFMCAHEQINYQNYMIHYFLGIVHYISISNHLDGIDKNSNSKKIDIINLWNMVEKLPEHRRNMIYSLIVRYGYGGMKGDEKLLIDNIFHHINRDCYQERFNDKIKSVQINKTIYINEFELSAVDFHCFPTIVGEIKKVHNEYTENEIKNAIWENNSSINKRKEKTIDNNSKLIWEEIYLTYKHIAKEFLTYYV